MTDNERERIFQQMAKQMADDMMAALFAEGAFTKPRPTAMRVTASGAFEVVELNDDGSIVERPTRCPRCGPILCAKCMAMTS